MVVESDPWAVVPLEALWCFAERTSTALAVAGADARLIWVSPNYEHLTGYKPEEVLGRRPSEFLHGGMTDPGVKQYMREQIARGEAFTADVLNYRKDGSTHWVNVDCVPYKAGGDRPEFYTAVITDISETRELKRALSEAQARLHALCDASSEGILLHHEGTIIDANTTACSKLGLSLRRLRGRRLMDFVVTETAEAYMPTIEPTEVLFRSQAGELFAAEIRCRQTYYQNQRVEVIAFQDLSHMKRAESRLHQSEERWQRLVESHPEPIVLVRDGKIKYINPSGAALLGAVLPATVCGRDVLEFFNDDDHRRLCRLAKLAMRRPMHTEEVAVQRLDGQRRYAEMTLSVIDDGHGPMLQVVARDTTERTRARHQIEMLAQALRAVADGVILTDLSGRITFANEAAEAMYGYSAAWLRRKHYGVLFPTEMETAEIRSLFTPQALEEGLRVETEHQRADGIVFPVALTSTLVHNTEGTPIGMITVVRDITEARRAAEELHRSQALLRAAFNHAPIGKGMADIETGHIITANPAFCRMTGYTLEELHGLTFTDLTHPDDREHDREAKQMLLRGEIDDARTVKRYVRKDGTVLWLEVSNTIIRDDAGAPIYFLGQMHDITAKRHAEEALRESEDRLRLALHAAEMGVFSVDLVQGLTYADARTLEIYGNDRPVMPAWDFLQHMHPDDRPIMDSAMLSLDAYPVGRATELIYRLLHPTKGLRWVLTKGRLLRDEADHVIGIIGTALDITERKLAEQQIRSYAEQLDLALSASEQGIWDWDQTRGEIAADARTCELLGLPHAPHATVTLPARDAIVNMRPEDQRRLDELVAGLFATQAQEYEQQYPVQVPGEPVHWVSAHGRLLYNDTGKPIRMVGTIRDITPEVLAEQALRESEQRYRTFIGTITEAVWRYELDPPVPVLLPKDEFVAAVAERARLAECNDLYAECLGYDKSEDILGRPVSELLGPSSHMSRLVEELYDHDLKLEDFIFTQGYRNGKLPRVFASNVVGHMHDGCVTHVWGTRRDITYLSRLTNDLTDRERREREHVHKELHDGPLARISAVTMFLTNALEDVESGDLMRAQQEINRSITQTKEGIREIRLMLKNLAPRELEKVGLVRTIETWAEYLRQYHHVTIHVNCRSARVEQISLEDKGNILGILKEASNNAWKHANPANILFEIEDTDGGVLFTVADDGQGFDMTCSRRHDTDTLAHFGLENMHTRATFIGATLNVSSTIGKGTTIECLIPESRLQPKAHEPG